MSAATDLELLARYLPRLEGRAQRLEPGSGPRSREDDDDAGAMLRERELPRAIAVAQRLAGVPGLERLVLCAAYLWGENENRADRCRRLGLLFADRLQRLAWLLDTTTIGDRAAQRAGERRLDQAEGAYAAADPVVGADPSWLGRTREHLSRERTRLAADEVQIAAAREANRLAARGQTRPGRPPRAQRRAHLQARRIAAVPAISATDRLDGGSIGNHPID